MEGYERKISELVRIVHEKENRIVELEYRLFKYERSVENNESRRLEKIN